MTNPRFVLPLLPLLLAACGTPTSDSNCETGRCDFADPNETDWTYVDLGDCNGSVNVRGETSAGCLISATEALKPGETLRIAIQGDRNSALSVTGSYGDQQSEGLVISLAQGDDRTGANRSDVSEAGWQDRLPAISVTEPVDGIWYFFVIQNAGSQTLEQSQVVIEVNGISYYDSPTKKRHIPFATSHCEKELLWATRTDGVQLSSDNPLDHLLPGTTYTFTAVGDVKGLELFAASLTEEVRFGEDVFHYPNARNEPALSAATSDKSITFTVEENKLYSIMMPRAESILPDFLRPAYKVDYALCTGERAECFVDCSTGG